VTRRRMVRERKRRNRNRNARRESRSRFRSWYEAVSRQNGIAYPRPAGWEAMVTRQMESMAEEFSAKVYYGWSPPECDEGR